MKPLHAIGFFSVLLVIITFFGNSPTPEPAQAYEPPPTRYAQAPPAPARSEAVQPQPPTPIPPSPAIVAPPPPIRPAEPLSIKISGPRHPTLGDRPIWHAKVSGDAGRPRWRVSPPTTGIIEEADGTIIEWEPPYAGKFTLYVSVGGANYESADDAVDVTIHQLVQSGPPPAPVAQPPIDDMEPAVSPLSPGRMAGIPNRDRLFWNRRIGELVSGSTSVNKVAEARAIGGCVLNLSLRVERDNFAGQSYIDDLRRQTVALLGVQRAAAWQGFFDGIGEDVTLQDLRHIEHALAHVVLSASRSPTGSKLKTAKET